MVKGNQISSGPNIAETKDRTTHFDGKSFLRFSGDKDGIGT